MRPPVAAVTILLMLLALPARPRAEACGPRLVAIFAEGAADIFALRNASTAGWTVQRIEIDLRGTAGRLILDVTGAGAGVSGWRPYAPASGTAAIVGHSRITDGDRLLSMAFSRFAPAERFEFTIDLDDTLPGTTQPWIDGSEILGGRVHAVFTGPGGATAERAATFDADGRADTGRHETCLMS